MGTSFLEAAFGADVAPHNGRRDCIYQRHRSFAVLETDRDLVRQQTSTDTKKRQSLPR